MDSDFEEDDVVAAVIALKLFKKFKRRSGINEGGGPELNTLYTPPATGASKKFGTRKV